MSIILVALAAALVAAQAWIIRGMFVLGAAPATSRQRSGVGETRPSVSVIIPAHDEERRLPATLDSLRAIEYDGDIEFVLVDDRSSDATGELLARAAAGDERFKVVTITEPSRRYAPKVNAVMQGIAASRGDVIVTSDADCSYSPRWVSALVEQMDPGAVMVCGYVETLPPGERPGWREWWRWIEAADWFSLMLVSRSMLRSGRAYASSANNQAYRRSALAAAGGFGASARAPSGDEDLLAQRLGARGRVVFAEAEDARVTTASAGSFVGFLRQRSRWVARYRHMVHYRPAFLAGLCVLGFESILLAGSLLAAPFAPRLAGVALACYAVQTAAMVLGLTIGARQLGRRRFGGGVALAWALLHPFLIATAVIWSWLAPGDWRAGAVGYRRSLARRRWRLLLRSLTARHGTGA